MKDIPKRIFFDTNVYIIGVADSSSAERAILVWAGFEERKEKSVEVVVSEELFDQIL